MDTAHLSVYRAALLCEKMEVMEPIELLQSVVTGGDALLFEDARALMTALLQGDFSEIEMADLLSALHERGETATELAGFADAMRSASLKLPLTDAERDTLVDTCGTGGDGSGTFNISTAVALVACAAGAKIAKHGNRAVTSRCGSADVLEALGIRTDHTPESAAHSIRQHGFAFLLATRMHPAMKFVVPVRRALPFRTVFNLLGPMTNPAGARRQVIGVYSAAAVPLVAEALAAGGHMAHALVVHGAGGLDELSLSGESLVAEVKGTEVRQYTLRPEDAGGAASQDALAGGDAALNADLLTRLFAGEPGPRRDIVLLNAAAVLLVGGLCDDLQAGARMAAQAIDACKVTALVQRLAALAQ
ncbi:MAG: anthranilate phosphoribosyltransferase [Janthinobacterium lividum]